MKVMKSLSLILLAIVVWMIKNGPKALRYWTVNVLYFIVKYNIFLVYIVMGVIVFNTWIHLAEESEQKYILSVWGYLYIKIMFCLLYIMCNERKIKNLKRKQTI
jgi:hypothetical protein